MRTLRRTVALVAVFSATARVVHGAPQFSDGSKGAFNPPPGVVTFDTDTGTWSGTVTGSGGRVVTQANSVEIEVFDFTTINLQAGVIVRAKGKRALALVATGPVVIDGVVNVDGEDSGGAAVVQRGGAGGPGGGGGGGGGDGSAHGGIVTGGGGGLGSGGDGYKGAPPTGIAGANGTGIAPGLRGFEGNGGAGGSGTNGSTLLLVSAPYGGGGGGGGPGGGGGGGYGNFLGCKNGEGIGSGAGGSYATKGGNSNRIDGVGAAAASGPTYGTDDLAVLVGGSGGGGGAEDHNASPGYNGGGGGGGAVMITSLASITLGASGVILAKGGSASGDPTRPGQFANTTVWSAGGGGSGGAIYLDAPVITNNGSLCTAGGIGGTADPTDSVYCPSSPNYKTKAGDGGGGRIAVFGGTAGNVCPSSGSVKTGKFKCESNAQCSGGTCDPNTKECIPGPIDAGPDAPSEAGVDAGVDAAPTVDAGVDSGKPDATGNGDDTLGGGGCACSTVGTSTSPSPWPLLAFGAVSSLLLVRRRRR
jgi:MYXO-CTERM domain-containing protein